VSDFLSRLAARAVGEAPRTRAPSAERGTAASRATAAELPVARATPSAPEVRAEPAELRVEAEPRATPPPAREGVAAEGPSEPIAPVTATVLRDAAAARPVVEPNDPTPESVAVRAGEPVPVVVATPVPATPSIERHVESRLQRVHTLETVTADEPPVRVHIGRLEVRANLEQPPRQQPKRRPERPQAETLSDYLRGRRSE